MALQHDNQISRNKYTNRISTDNYSNQKYTYDTGSNNRKTRLNFVVGRRVAAKNSSGGSGSKIYHQGKLLSLINIGFEGQGSGDFKHQKKMNIRNSQRALNSSDADEARKHFHNVNYDSPHSGSGKLLKFHNFWEGMEHHQNLQLKKNYNKLADKQYRSGGSGSTSGGTSMEGMQYFKNQYYPRMNLNVSDVTDQQNVHSMQDDKDSVFYSAQVRSSSLIL